MYFTTGASNGLTITFMPQIQPRCVECGGAPQLKTNDGQLFCRSCIEIHNRRVAIAQASEWLTGLFVACTREQRPKAYRALAAVFHPDAGGSEDLMKALNAVKEQFP